MISRTYSMDILLLGDSWTSSLPLVSAYSVLLLAVEGLLDTEYSVILVTKTPCYCYYTVHRVAVIQHKCWIVAYYSSKMRCSIVAQLFHHTFREVITCSY